MDHAVGFLGIGVDIETICRFNKCIEQKDTLFLSKIYTKKELDYCLSKRSPAQHLAACFAGKEAAINALSFDTQKKYVPKDIEITHLKSGAPKIRLRHTKNICMMISLSHCNDKAIAFAVALSTSERSIPIRNLSELANLYHLATSPPYMLS